MTMNDIHTLNIVKVKKAVKEKLVPISYSCLFRMASNPESPYRDCFLYLGNSLCIDLDEFFRIGKKEANKRRGSAINE